MSAEGRDVVSGGKEAVGGTASCAAVALGAGASATVAVIVDVAVAVGDGVKVGGTGV